MGRAYIRPQVEAPVVSLVPENAAGAELTPNTPVLVIHRGSREIRDKFDGIDYVIQPGFVEMPYGAALHFQKRACVPTTRNPETQTEQSFLGILGLDDAHLCVPFTSDELERIYGAPEAIDRAGLASRNDREVRLIKASVSAPMRSNSMRPRISGEGQISEAAQEAAAHAFDRPDTTDAKVEAAEARRERARR